MASGYKTGGRQVGTLNKKTVVLQTFLQAVAQGGHDKFKREIMKLNGKEYVEAYLKMIEYIAPKLQRSTVMQSNDKTVVIFKRKE